MFFKMATVGSDSGSDLNPIERNRHIQPGPGLPNGVWHTLLVVRLDSRIDKVVASMTMAVVAESCRLGYP